MAKPDVPASNLAVYLPKLHANMFWGMGVNSEGTAQFTPSQWPTIDTQFASQFPQWKTQFQSKNFVNALMDAIDENPYDDFLSDPSDELDILSAHASALSAGVELNNPVSAASTIAGWGSTVGSIYSTISTLMNLPSSTANTLSSIAGATASDKLSQLMVVAKTAYDTSFKSDVSQAIAAVASVVNVAADVNWSAHETVAKTVADANYGPSKLSSYITDYLAAAESTSYNAYRQRISRFKRGMADIGAVNTSAFIIGLMGLEDAMSRETLEVRGQLTVEAYKSCIDFVKTAISQMQEGLRTQVQGLSAAMEGRLGEAGHVLGFIGGAGGQAAALDSVRVQASLPAMDTLRDANRLAVSFFSEQLGTCFKVNALYNESLKTYYETVADYIKTSIQAQSTYEMQTIGIQDKKLTWPIDRFLQAGTFLGSPTSGPLLSPAPELWQQKLSTGLSIAGALGSVASAIFGAGSKSK